MTGQLAVGLALATAIWNGDGEFEAVLCPTPIDRRCMRRMHRARRQERALKAWRQQRRRATRAWRGWLYSTRTCESHGNYRIATGNGFYGAYQFVPSTWWAVGGRGWPHTNPPLEQDYRAVVLASTSGTGAWPVCG